MLGAMIFNLYFLQYTRIYFNPYALMFHLFSKMSIYEVTNSSYMQFIINNFCLLSHQDKSCNNVQAFINYYHFSLVPPQISGEFLNVQDALYSATSRLRDHHFASTQNSVGTRSLSSGLADTGPPGRLRDPVPVGPYVSPGLRAPQAPQVYRFLSAGWFSTPRFCY